MSLACLVHVHVCTIMQIMTGIEVNYSESYFPKLRKYCPCWWLTIDRWWQSLFVLLYLWSKWRWN